MMNRITERDLEAVRQRIEWAHGLDAEAPIWSRDETGGNVSAIGRFYVDHAYGGVALYRIISGRGAVEDIFRAGHMPKRELYYRMQAYLDGFGAAAS